MSLGRRTDAIVVVVLVAALLGVFVALRLRLAGTGSGTADRPDGPPGEGVPARQVNPPASETAVAAAEQGDPMQSASPSVETASTGKDGSSASESASDQSVWVYRAPVDFSEEDLSDCGRGVVVDLGSYNTRKGDTFEVGLSLAGPALESCTVIVHYDPEMLAVVPHTAEPAGRQFRGGLECYADEQSGRLVLIHSGIPGMKNVDRGAGRDLSAVWRMRALRSGSTTLRLGEQTSFMNGRGESEAYRAAGGAVVIR